MLFITLVCFAAWLACVIASAPAENLGLLSGTVHDVKGSPLGGVSVVIVTKASPRHSARTTTNAQGEFHFAGLGSGDYELSASLTSYTLLSTPVVHIESVGKQVTADLTLLPESQKPQFQAAGIHGLIDPGGYSAAANSDAATRLLRGIADLRRTDDATFLASSTDWSCDRQSSLESEVAAHPDQAAANASLGQFYLAHDQLQESIPLLEHALQLDSHDMDAAQNLAIAYLQSNEFERARSILTSLVVVRNSPATHQLLARADEGNGLFKQAAQEYAIAEKQAPSEESIFGEGYETLLAGSAKDALLIFGAGIQKYPKSVSLQIADGTAQFLSGHAADAVNSFLKAIELDSQDPRPYSFLAAASALSHDQSEKISKVFETYSEQNPSNSAAIYFYALVLSRLSTETSPARVESLLKHSIELNANDARAHLLLADMYARRKEYEDAVPEYESAIRLSPELSEAHYRLAMTYKRLGNSAQSARQKEIFEKTKSDHASALDNNGMAETQGIDLAQFISVMNTPKQRMSAETQCGLAAR